MDDDAFDAMLLALDVREALDELTPKHREVLELHYHGGLPSCRSARRWGCR